MKIDGKEYLDLVFRVSDVPNIVRALAGLRHPHFVKPLETSAKPTIGGPIAAIYVPKENIRDLEILREVLEFFDK